MKTRWRILVQTGIIVIGTFLSLLASEAVLRLSGYGYSGALFVSDSCRSDPGAYIVDKHFYGRFFPVADREWILNSGNWGWEIKRGKEPGTIRIFVLGGSVALGDQTDYAFSNARILEVMLRKAFPGTRFEIFNLACGALNSHIMRRVARQAAAFSPDIFLVYMGNNEYLGPYGPAWSPGGMPPDADRVQFRISLQECRLIQVLDSLLSSDKYLISGGPQSVFEQTAKVRHDDPGRQTMYESFDTNLSDICKTASASGAVTILCTVGNNLRDWTPYAPLHRADIVGEDLMQWENHFRAGADAQQRWDVEKEDAVREVLGHYDAARRVDEFHADLQFRLGQCYWVLGEYADARKAFTLARDYDGFAIRADSTINRIIRECSAEHEECVLADIEGQFAQASEQGIMGGGLFYDYVHVLFEGDYLIAAGVFERMREVLIKRFHGEQVEDIIPLEECRRMLGMSPYLEALFLKRVVEEVEVSKTYNKKLDLSGLKKKQLAAESRLHDRSFDEALGALKSTELYKEGDVPISRLLVELLQGSGRMDEAREEALRIAKRFPNRPDAQRIQESLTE